MDVRPATPADVSALRSIARRSWERDPVVTRETATETVEEWYGQDRLTAEVTASDVRVLVAVAEDVVAFSHAVLDGSVGTVLRLYVDPDYRREGVGSHLLEAACRDLADRGVERVQAMTLAENDPGIAFYRTNGFERISTGETIIGGESYPEHVYERPVD
jgi:ribosomal protein S18 acetylase RimI-like enzyme